jgi:hypothetical protein
MSTAGGIELGGKEVEEEAREDPIWHDDWPLWKNKLEAWKVLVRRGCPGLIGPNFCMWQGHSCYYNGCPRRIFEEVMIIKSALPSPPAGNLRQQIKQLEKRMNKLQKRVEKKEEVSAAQQQ